MQERGQGNFLEKSVREKMKGITFILMQSNSLSGESRDCCFAAQMFHSGQRSRKYHKLRYPQNIRFIKASENWRKMTDLLAGKNFFKRKKNPTKIVQKYSLFIFVVSWHGRGSSLPSTGSIWLPQASAEESQASFRPTHKRLYIIVIIITGAVCWFCNNSLMFCVESTKTAAWGLELTVGELLQRLHLQSYSP